MMKDKTIAEFAGELSSANPVPGGGGASAAIGALGTALGLMVTNLTINNKKYEEYKEEMMSIRDVMDEIRDELMLLIDKDAEAFEPVAKAYKLPPEEREKVMDKALYEASCTPLLMMETISRTFPYFKILSEKGSKMAVTDVGAGVLFAYSALEGTALNVYINTKQMKDREVAKKLNDKAEELIAQGREAKEAIYNDVLSRMK